MGYAPRKGGHGGFGFEVIHRQYNWFCYGLPKQLLLSFRAFAASRDSKQDDHAKPRRREERRFRVYGA
jgi:hypothetical protein